MHPNFQLKCSVPFVAAMFIEPIACRQRHNAGWRSVHGWIGYGQQYKPDL